MTRKEAIAVLSDRDNFLWWEMSKAEREYYTEVFDMAISALENNRDWIPVSSGNLPKIGQRVLATIESYDEGRMVRETIYDKYGFLCGHGIAWQPLPEPFKSESEDI